jgi:hypothetical protein
MRFGSQFGLALYDREQKHVAHSNGRRPAEPAIDSGFAQWRQVTSQRALAARNSKLASDVPVLGHQPNEQSMVAHICVEAANNNARR